MGKKGRWRDIHYHYGCSFNHFLWYTIKYHLYIVCNILIHIRTILNERNEAWSKKNIKSENNFSIVLQKFLVVVFFAAVTIVGWFVLSFMSCRVYISTYKKWKLFFIYIQFFYHTNKYTAFTLVIVAVTRVHFEKAKKNATKKSFLWFFFNIVFNHLLFYISSCHCYCFKVLLFNKRFCF